MSTKTRTKANQCVCCKRSKDEEELPPSIVFAGWNSTGEHSEPRHGHEPHNTTTIQSIPHTYSAHKTRLQTKTKVPVMTYSTDMAACYEWLQRTILPTQPYNHTKNKTFCEYGSTWALKSTHSPSRGISDDGWLLYKKCFNPFKAQLL